jgi:hypothetical protein
MTQGRYRTSILAKRFAPALFAVLWAAVGASAQDELRPYRQVAYESGHGTATVKGGPAGAYYALNRADRCIWMFSSSGSTTGRVGSIGMGPSDLLSPKDVAVDLDGNAIVADGSDAVKVFSPKGELLVSVPFHRPEHVAAMTNGEILVSGFPKEYLFYRFDRHGRQLASLGTPAKVDDDPFFNAVLNMGTISVDASDNIYYVFRYMLTPTVRKYRPDGTLAAEWHLTDGEILARIVQTAKQKYQDNKKASNHGGVPVLTAASFDENSKTLWVASGAQVTELDSSGRTVRTIKLVRPDGRPLQAEGIIVERDIIRASTYLAGVFEYQKPQ